METSPPNQILELLFTFPRKQFSYRDIERNTDLSIGTISKYVPLLEKQDLLKRDVRPTAKYVSANFSNPTFRQLKRANNLKKLYESNIINELEIKLRPTSIVLFGSYSRGEDTEESDIDIAILGGRKFQLNRKPFEKKLQRHINLTQIQRVTKMQDEFKQTLINAIVVSGLLSDMNGF